MRRLRLRQWLVLLLRTLIILLLVSAFARPAYRGGVGNWIGSSPPTAAVLLFDRSYSTTYRLPGGRLFDELREQANALLQLFKSRDQVILIPFAGRPSGPEQGAGGLSQATDRVRELLPSQETTNLPEALQAAAESLDGETQWQREVFLFTDLAQHNWAEVDDHRGWLPGVPLYICTPRAAARSNVYIDEVSIPSWMPAPASNLALWVGLTNDATQPADEVPVDLYLEGERVRRQNVDLEPGESARIEFAVSPRRAGRVTGYVEVEDDALLLDNRRYFALDMPDSIRVLALGGQPVDTYYPRRALSAASLADPALDLRFGLLEELGEPLLQDVDVLLLCNLQRLSPEATTLVHQFVARGGGLVVFPSAQAEPSVYNRDLLPGLMPTLLKGVVGRPDAGAASRSATTFQRLDADRPHHPLFEGLLSPEPGDQPRFHASFELVTRTHLRPLVHFEDGRPAIAEAWKGRGRALLFSVPLSLAWSDLPIKGLYVPLMHRLVRYLSLPPDHRAEYLVGETVYRHLDSASVKLAIEAESPGGNRQLISPELIDGRYYWKIPRVGESGLWRLWRGGQVVDSFPVNLDARESAVQPVDRELLERVFGPERTHVVLPGDDLAGEVLEQRYGRELWQEFVALALILLLAEMWIARAPRGRSAAEPADAAA